MTMPILRGPALRDIEIVRQHDNPPLMERAGHAAAEIALGMQLDIAGPPLIFAGPGNNGGDAFVVARLLKAAGFAPVVVFAGTPGRLPADALAAYGAWRRSGGAVLDAVPEQHYGLLIDGLFGIGLSRPAEGRYAEWIQRINAYPGPVLSLDCPSGLDSETGQARGPTVKATRTVTFIAMKPGLLTLDGPDHCGTTTVADLGLTTAVHAAPHGQVIDPALFGHRLQPRLRNSHKGSHGSAGIIGGASGMAGAAQLAGTAALKLGAGRVYVGMLERIAVDSLQPELMLREARDTLHLASALAVGPGLGESTTALDLLSLAIDSPLPLVLDADALNLLAAHPVMARRLLKRQQPAILTPHPAEAARLLDQSTAQLQQDRLAAAMALSRRYGSHVVLKGCGSILVLADGRWFINATGNPGLASAGSGDVLTGMIVALLAQGWEAASALLAAVHLHGKAADACVAEGRGPVGLTAGELVDPARRILNQWMATTAGQVASDRD